ncbi:MAG: 50S ribosomal protein L35 [Proteobacteria bacterium]|jgi:large subunit ribosomal protein L35|nr:50S ribosomal protein L35 [Pseudomonadota bacterium]
MPKMKTKQAAAKRLRVTKSGKLKAKASNRRHILTAKSNKSKRQTRPAVYLHKADEARIKLAIPYGLPK